MSDMILVHDEIDTKLDELAPLIVRGQFNKAVADLKTAFEELVEADELDEARLVIGITKRARRREL